MSGYREKLVTEGLAARDKAAELSERAQEAARGGNYPAAHRLLSTATSHDVLAVMYATDIILMELKEIRERLDAMGRGSG